MEHGSTLLHSNDSAAPLTEWSALYWYAGAHEDTMCDFSAAAEARQFLRLPDAIGNAVSSSRRATGATLSAARASTGDALGSATRRVNKSLRRAFGRMTLGVNSGNI